jgi:hypothetical protein
VFATHDRCSFKQPELSQIKAGTRVSKSSAVQLAEAERRIAWILAHPGFSDWLKDALRKAVDRDPVDVVNDLELFGHVIRPWASARIDLLLEVFAQLPRKL